MNFSFADVEAVLARMHNVGAERRSAFSHRIKHLQRLRFPPGTNTGRGRAAVYSPRHAVQLAVVLEMNQVGLTPDRAVKLSTVHMDRIQRAVYLALDKILSDDQEQVLIVFDPVALSDLREHDEWDETEATFDINTESEFRAKTSDYTNLRSRRYALINITAVVDELAHRLGEVSGHEEHKIMREILRSANDEVWRHVAS